MKSWFLFFWSKQLKIVTIQYFSGKRKKARQFQADLIKLLSIAVYSSGTVVFSFKRVAE
jgi:hypothetical protein